MADYFTFLAMARILPTESLSTLHTDQALQKHGLAEFLQSAFESLEGTADLASKMGLDQRFSHVKVDTILSLAWPRYLQELAASKSPITQVCASMPKACSHGRLHDCGASKQL